jgi:hypothetical protein
MALSVAVLGGVCGCATEYGAWDKAGYTHTLYGYGVPYRDPDKQMLVGADWDLDNYTRDSSGFYAEKVGKEYRASRSEDIDGDGTISPGEKIDEAIFDLKWVSKTTNGVIWTKAHPILKRNAGQPLELILDNYADSMSGAGLYAQGNLFGIEQVMVRNFMSFLTSRSIGQVGSAPSLFGAIEIGETERLRQDPQHRSGKLKLGFVKFHYFVPLEAQTGGSSGAPQTEHVASKPTSKDPWPQVSHKGRPCEERTGLLIAGYYNAPKYFDAGLPDFDALAARITFPDAEALPVPALTETSPASPAPAATPMSPQSPSNTEENQPAPTPPPKIPDQASNFAQ